MIFSLLIKNLMRKKEDGLRNCINLKDPSYRERDILSVRMNNSCVAIEIRNILLLRYRNRGGGCSELLGGFPIAIKVKIKSHIICCYHDFIR